MPPYARWRTTKGIEEEQFVLHYHQKYVPSLNEFGCFGAESANTMVSP